MKKLIICLIIIIFILPSFSPYIAAIENTPDSLKQDHVEHVDVENQITANEENPEVQNDVEGKLSNEFDKNNDVEILEEVTERVANEEDLDTTNTVEEEKDQQQSKNLPAIHVLELIGEKQKIEASYLSLQSMQTKTTSKVAQIKSTNTKIYKDPLKNEYTLAGQENINKVFYIKLEGTYNNKKYYLISNEPSSQKGVVGWVRADDKNISVYDHKHVDTKSKILYFKGTGVAYSRIWGGSKNLVLNTSDLRLLQYKEFKINMTEKVGNNIWYRGTYDGSKGNIWIHSSHLTTKEEATTSRVGQIQKTGIDIYKKIDDITSMIKSDSNHLNRVYYIKKQIKFGNETFYLISTEPSSTEGVVGWVNANDIKTYSHTGVDKNEKMFYLKGTGVAYSRIWGGSKLIVFNTSDLSQRKGYGFQVDLTEKVGNNIWYRGIVDGKKVWIHSSHVTEQTGAATSKLGKINNSNVPIYKRLGDQSSIILAGETYTGIVYYIKREAMLHGKKYYLISNEPSSTAGIVGWVEDKEEDITTHEHVGIDAKPKVFYVKRAGVAYNRPWGGTKNIVYNSNQMKDFIGEIFEVHLTQRVGNNIWYRGELKGKTVWIHSSHLNAVKYSTYNLSLQQALNIQMKAKPQTDKRPKYAWVSKDYIKNDKVTASVLNVRLGPGTGYKKIGELNNGQTVKILDEFNGWYAIEYNHNRQWVHASPKDVLYYLNPDNFIKEERQKFQFLDLSVFINAPVSTLNDILNGKGVLHNKGKYFSEEAKRNSINEIYLIAHAIHETDNGKSALSNGSIRVGQISENKWVSFQPNATYIAEKYYDDKAKGWKWKVTKNNDFKETDAKNVKKVYNMFGIGAKDEHPSTLGSIKAYQEGWFTPEDAIIGGAKFVANDYIHHKDKQNTLYKMRWNPDAMVKYGYASHQYATDIGWASKQADLMYKYYQYLDSYTLTLDIPVYK